jgi:hypothetical protein
VLLQLSADDYGAALEGRLSTMLEQKVQTLLSSADGSKLAAAAPMFKHSCLQSCLYCQTPGSCTHSGSWCNR